jgi:hypothetical protein
MAINDERHFEFWGKVESALGRIEANQKNYLEYLGAVNSNLKDLSKNFNHHINEDNLNLGEIRESMARMEQTNKSSAEIKYRFDAHIQDIEAHGAKPRGEVWALLGKIVAVVAAIVSVGVGLGKMFGTH